MILISTKQIYDLLVQVCSLLNKNNINYLVHGSMAKNLFADKQAEVNDIDVIVSENDFQKLENLLSDDFNITITDFNAHANSKRYKGKDDKPFDISFDSYEHYFEKNDVEISDASINEVMGIKIKTLPFVKLESIYKTYPKVKA